MSRKNAKHRQAKKKGSSPLKFPRTGFQPAPTPEQLEQSRQQLIRVVAAYRADQMTAYRPVDPVTQEYNLGGERRAHFYRGMCYLEKATLDIMCAMIRAVDPRMIITPDNAANVVRSAVTLAQQYVAAVDALRTEAVEMCKQGIQIMDGPQNETPNAEAEEKTVHEPEAAADPQG